MQLPYNAALADQQPVAARGFHHLRGGARGGRFGLAILHQFERLHQSHAAHIADDGVFIPQLLQLAPQVCAGLGGIGQQVLLLDQIQHGFGRGRGNRIAAERRDGQSSDARRHFRRRDSDPDGQPLPKPLALVMTSGVTP